MKHGKKLVGVLAMTLISVLMIVACNTPTGDGDGSSSGGSGGGQVKILKPTGSKGSLTDEDLAKPHLNSIDVPKTGSTMLEYAVNKGDGWVKRSSSDNVIFYHNGQNKGLVKSIYGESAPTGQNANSVIVKNGDKIKVEATLDGKTVSAESTIRLVN